MTNVQFAMNMTNTFFSVLQVQEAWNLAHDITQIALHMYRAAATWLLKFSPLHPSEIFFVVKHIFCVLFFPLLEAENCLDLWDNNTSIVAFVWNSNSMTDRLP